MPSSSRVQSESPVDHANGDTQDDVNGTLTFRISRKELLSLQIRALLDASDEVDLSAEVAEDLLQSLPTDSNILGGSCEHDGEEGDNHHDREYVAQEENEEDGVEITAADGEISLSSVFHPDADG
jgi:NAD-dependent histone deacetylase SIR2